jgi:predicted MFS family arabinose efflux permease
MTERIRQGLQWAWASEGIRAALLLAGLVSLAGTSALVLMPVFADQIFHGGPDELGLLLGSTGAGSLLGALLLAHRSDQKGLERLVGVLATGAGVALVALSLVNDLELALSLLAVVGFGMASATTGSNTLIQLKVDNEYRGRIMALFSLVVVGLSPLGSLAVGVLAEAGGPLFAVAACGVALAVGSVTFLVLRTRSR